MKELSLGLQIVHLLGSIVAPFIPILTDKYDLIYVIFILCVTLHWIIFEGECILSYFEKKLLDSNYNFGDIHGSLFKNILGKKTTDIFIQLNFISLIIILFRNYSKPCFTTISLMILFIVILYYSSGKIKSKSNLN